MTIIELYEKILESLGLQADEQGLVSLLDVADGQPNPIMVNGKRLALPTRERLRSGDWEDLIAFHPLSENVARGGVSPVLKKLRALVNYRLNAVISVLMAELMEIAADGDYHQKLSPREGEFLSYAKEATAKTVKGLEGILDNMSTTGPNSMVSIYLKRPGKWRAETYSRVAVASFPILDEFENDPPVVFGKKLSSKKDKKTIESLFNWLLPKADLPDTYSYGSNSMVAPYFQALMLSYVTIAGRLNKITRRYKAHLDNHKALLMNVTWSSEIEDLSKYHDLIPALEGNDGTLKDEDEESPVKAQPAPSVSGWKSPVAKEEPVEEGPYEVSAKAPVVGERGHAPARSTSRPSEDKITIDDVMAGSRRQSASSFAPQASPAWAAPVQPQNPFSYQGYTRGMPDQPSFGHRGGGPSMPWMNQQQTPPWGGGGHSGFSGGGMI